MSTAERVRHYREQMGWSLNKLSAVSGMSTDYIHKIEQGKATNIGIKKLMEIAQALNVSVHDLIDEQTSNEGI